MNFVEKLILKAISRKVERWFALERSLASLDAAHKSAEMSPAKSWPDPKKIPLGNEVPFSFKNMSVVGKNLKNCIKEGRKAISSIADNPPEGKVSILEDELKNFETIAREHGISDIGYCKLPPHLIFKERAVLYDYAIVFIKEMDKEDILKAPSLDTFRMVMATYNALGIITNQMTTQLRNMGFQAHASHPLGGLVLYPPLAAEAGLGWFGRHGLLITPEFGARERISAIFVNINNLPLNSGNDHQWIEEFCRECGRCIRTCPGKAILEEPILRPSGRKTCIERSKCLPEFVNKQGCTVCIKECVFTSSGYDKIHKQYLNKKSDKLED